jgi:hypothetical protein
LRATSFFCKLTLSSQGDNKGDFLFHVLQYELVQTIVFTQPISGVIAIVIAITVRHIVSVSTKGNGTSTVAGLHGHFANIIAHLRRSHAERLVFIGLICVVLFSVSFAITLQTTPLMELFREDADIRY